MIDEYNSSRKSNVNTSIITPAEHSDPERYVHCCGKDILREWVGCHLQDYHKQEVEEEQELVNLLEIISDLELELEYSEVEEKERQDLFRYFRSIFSQHGRKEFIRGYFSE
jgi:hypothetical protein